MRQRFRYFSAQHVSLMVAGAMGGGGQRAATRAGVAASTATGPSSSCRPMPGHVPATAVPGTAAASEPGGAGQVLLQYEAPVRAMLLKRYKRFLGDVALGAAHPAPGSGSGMGQKGEEQQPAPPTTTVVHVPNTGPMSGLLGHLPSEVLLSSSASARRKYAHTLEWIQPQPGEAWVGVHSAKANALVRALLEAGRLPGLPPYAWVQQEVKFGAGGASRCDFVLHAEAPAAAAEEAEEEEEEGSREAGRPRQRRKGELRAGSRVRASSKSCGLPAAVGSSCCYVEVKSVTDYEDLPGVGAWAATRVLSLGAGPPAWVDMPELRDRIQAASHAQQQPCSRQACSQ